MFWYLFMPAMGCEMIHLANNSFAVSVAISVSDTGVVSIMMKISLTYLGKKFGTFF